MVHYETAVFTVKLADHYGNHRCHVEKNVPMAFILPSRFQVKLSVNEKSSKSLIVKRASPLSIGISP